MRFMWEGVVFYSRYSWVSDLLLNFTFPIMVGLVNHIWVVNQNMNLLSFQLWGKSFSTELHEIPLYELFIYYTYQEITYLPISHIIFQYLIGTYLPNWNNFLFDVSILSSLYTEKTKNTFSFFYISIIIEQKKSNSTQFTYILETGLKSPFLVTLWTRV